MLRVVVVGLLVCTLILSVSPFGSGYSHCNCDDEGLWTTNAILECQKVSDFLIAIAYFSIPIELIYFISCSNIPFKWVLVQFIAFIVLCGMTHLLNGWTYFGPHSFHLMMTLTVFKLLTALVSCATAITLLTLIPLLLKVKVRELFLTQNLLMLDQEIGMMRKKKEVSLHVRMLTREIRKSLDKHNILYTTLVELSKALDLQNCAVWMPNESKTEMYLSHELKPSTKKTYPISIPISNPEVVDIKGNKGVRILKPDSTLGMASTGGVGDAGSVAAIRMPMLRVSNFNVGTTEITQTRYAILVLVLPDIGSRVWSDHELDIVESVADQVTVALSHASVLEESQLMREKLAFQNRALQQAKKDAMMASQARNSYQKVMSHGMRRPMHSILGILSMFQDENLKFEQKILVDTMARTGNVLSTLINDVIDIPAKDTGKFPLKMGTFQLHSVIKESCCLARSLFICHGIKFFVDIQNTLPDKVIGDETRTFQVILHIVGYLLQAARGSVIFRVTTVGGSDSESQNDKRGVWRQGAKSGYANVKFAFEITGGVMQADVPTSASYNVDKRHFSNENKEILSFTMCKKLVQMMQGNIWISPNSFGPVQTMNLLLRFQLKCFLDYDISPIQPLSNSLFRGLRVMLADDDSTNRTVTKKLLEKLGCQVCAVSSGFECLSALGPALTYFQVVILDLYMPEMDGFEVASRIRQYKRSNWPIIVALTASAEEDIMERCLQEGMDGLIRKPVVLHGIADELRRFLLRPNEGI